MSEEGSGAKEIGRRRFIKKALYAAGATFGASAGFNIRKAQRDAESEEEMLLRKSSSQAPATAPNPQPSEAPIIPAPEVEELSINPDFKYFHNALSRFINTDVDPEFWKGLEGILQKDTQDIYDYVDFYTPPGGNEGVREIGYMYYSGGVKKETQPDLNVVLLKDMGKVSVSVVIKLDAIKATNGINQDNPDMKISLEEERVKKAHALFNKPELDDLRWESRNTFDRSSIDPKTNISYRQQIFPAEGNLNYLITMPPGDTTFKFIVPEKPIPRPKTMI